ncbi:hypothetical protein CDV31_010141 [Fusarium ambrosium]|uniref:Uncharacterized protein n=1 Tax=Fusarium ambrosium TaxID=131363 RepID=A0A428TQ80_9HYPO|nr:hypothetical protein CDV31_010141 [Fusarium ambrosium]
MASKGGFAGLFGDVPRYPWSQSLRVFIATIDVRLHKQASAELSFNNKANNNRLKVPMPVPLDEFTSERSLRLTTSTLRSHYDDELSSMPTPSPTETIMNRYLRSYDDPFSAFNPRYSDPSRNYRFVVMSRYRNSRLLWVWILSGSDTIELDLRLCLLDTP